MRFVRLARLMASLVAVVTLALVGSLLVGTSAAGAATRAGAVAEIAPSYDADILYWTNSARRAHGLAPLAAQTCVDGFAERWTLRMARFNKFKHQKLRPILRRCHRSTAGENIAYGTGAISAKTIVQMWMRSPGHRRNILNPRFKYIGVAAWRSARTNRLYATQDFSG